MQPSKIQSWDIYRELVQGPDGQLSASTFPIALQDRRDSDEPPLQCLDRFEKLATIDLRIDYLRPAVSTHFDLHAEVLRLGSRVGNTRMEFYAADGLLVATGAGAEACAAGVLPGME